jgi:hypothetical protein
MSANTLYDIELRDWDRVEIPSATSQSGAYAARTEASWSNRQISAPTLFDCGTTT